METSFDLHPCRSSPRSAFAPLRRRHRHRRCRRRRRRRRRCRRYQPFSCSFLLSSLRAIATSAWHVHLSTPRGDIDFEIRGGTTPNVEVFVQKRNASDFSTTQLFLLFERLRSNSSYWSRFIASKSATEIVTERFAPQR